METAHMNPPPHWSQLQEAGALTGIRIMFAIYRWFGRTPFRILLFPVVLYFFLFRHTARAASMDYLSTLRDAGHLPNGKSLSCLSYRHMLNFSESLLDKLAVWIGDITLEDIRFHNRAALEQLINQNRGGVIVGSHLGNLEVCRALSLQRPDIRINVFMHTEHAAKFSAMLRKAGSESEVNVMAVTDITPATAILMQQKVDAGEFIVITGDRTPVASAKNATPVQFFGRSANFPTGPFILASILKCPVLTMFCIRAEGKTRKRYDIYVDVFEDKVKLPRHQRNQHLRAHIQKFAYVLEQYCTKAPLQWYNFYPFWDKSTESVTLL